MADQLYLSLWYPNFRLEALPAALVGVLRQFALVSASGTGGGKDKADKRVSAATVYPIDWSESPSYQRIYVLDHHTAENTDTSASIIENAVADATDILHDDMAYEFEMKWNLWTPETDSAADTELALDTAWKLQPTTVKFVGFGPQFDGAGFEQNGHIRVDFGVDTPWVLDEDDAVDEDAAQRIRQNVEKLLAFTLSVEKNCGISSRLLWTESGEPLAEKLIARLQRLN